MFKCLRPNCSLFVYFFIILFSLLFCNPDEAVAQPYSGTIFIDPDIITQDDSSAFKSISYIGRGMRTVYDRRSGWVNINAWLFKITWNDSLTTEAQINPEFGSLDESREQAEKYGIITGRLPHCLRI